jgi:hypothetical protein
MALDVKTISTRKTFLMTLLEDIVTVKINLFLTHRHRETTSVRTRTSCLQRLASGHYVHTKYFKK